MREEMNLVKGAWDIAATLRRSSDREALTLEGWGKKKLTDLERILYVRSRSRKINRCVKSQ